VEDIDDETIETIAKAIVKEVEQKRIADKKKVAAEKKTKPLQEEHEYQKKIGRFKITGETESEKQRIREEGAAKKKRIHVQELQEKQEFDEKKGRFKITFDLEQKRIREEAAAEERRIAEQRRIAEERADAKKVERRIEQERLAAEKKRIQELQEKYISNDYGCHKVVGKFGVSHIVDEKAERERKEAEKRQRDAVKAAEENRARQERERLANAAFFEGNVFNTYKIKLGARVQVKGKKIMYKVLSLDPECINRNGSYTQDGVKLLIQNSKGIVVKSPEELLVRKLR